jgi:hypothetical protein
MRNNASDDIIIQLSRKIVFDNEHLLSDMFNVTSSTTSECYKYLSYEQQKMLSINEEDASLIEKYTYACENSEIKKANKFEVLFAKSISNKLSELDLLLTDNQRFIFNHLVLSIKPPCHVLLGNDLKTLNTVC